MASFCKNEDCPTSQDLVAFLNGEISVRDADPIRRHAAECEFCSAELEFYERYPQLDEQSDLDSPAIPEPLYELATALLTPRPADAHLLDSLLGIKNDR